MTFSRSLSRTLLLALGAFLMHPASLPAQSSSSSSSDSDSAPARTAAPALPRIAQPEAGGSAVTLETSEPLFDLAASLNACGYDAGLENSAPVRQKIREEMNQELAASAPARDARDALCTYIRQHALTDASRSLAQYVSLALFLTPPPTLTPTADISDLPPDAAAVADILPLVRAFAEQVHLNALWAEHRTEYDSWLARVHDPLTSMVLSTNLYLHLPVSSYDGRRFLVLLEPMLAPSETNARIYGSDFAVVVSPDAHADANTVPVPMDLIRHTYLHFDVEPLIYSRAQQMNTLLPLLKTVQSAPIDFSYKSDIVSLVNECLIKAIEIRTMDVGIPKPQRPNTRERADLERYDLNLAAWERQAEAVRRRNVDQQVHQGWILVDSFYNELGKMQHDGTSLRDEIGPMVFGMEVGREVNRAQQIVFVPGSASSDVVRRVVPKPAALDLAELKLMKGDTDGAEEMANAALKTDPKNAQAHYLLGRIDLMEGDPDEALAELTQTIALSKDPRTIAWAHIYLGRMYDIARDPNDPSAHPERDKAVAEYRAALANRDSQPDTKAAAEKGIKEPFALPKRQADDPADDNTPLDPTGKAEKDAYRPPPPLPPQQ